MANEYRRGQLIEYRYFGKWGSYGIVLGVNENGSIRIFPDEGTEDTRNPELVRLVSCVNDIPDLPLDEGSRHGTRKTFKDLAKILEELENELKKHREKGNPSANV